MWGKDEEDPIIYSCDMRICNNNCDTIIMGEKMIVQDIEKFFIRMRGNTKGVHLGRKKNGTWIIYWEGTGKKVVSQRVQGLHPPSVWIIALLS